MGFELDARLAEDCFELGRLDFCRVLLMNNADLSWFILVPETGHAEVCDLSDSERERLWAEVDVLSGFVREHYPVDKLNVAAIGNIVRQLHVHVVGRREDDYCWPGVVWGAEVKRHYKDEEVTAVRQSLVNDLQGFHG